MVQSRPLIERVMPTTLGQGPVEDAEAVDLADAKVDGQRGGRDEPAVESGRGDRSLAIEKTVESHGCRSGS